jgi:hypothetical protein
MKSKNTTKKSSKNAKASKPRMSADAARAEGAAKVKAALTNGKKSKAAKPAKERRPSGLDLAAKVLAASKEPLAARTIAERTVAAGWKTSGKTPHATLYAAIIREIAAKGSSARFKKTDRGLFTAHAGAK